MILHSGLKTPGHPNYTHGSLFEVAQTLPFHLPEGTDSLGFPRFQELSSLAPLQCCRCVPHPLAPLRYMARQHRSLPNLPISAHLNCAGQDKFGPKAWDIIIRGPSHLDQPDIHAPAGGRRAQLASSLPPMVAHLSACDSFPHFLAPCSEFADCAVPLVWWPAYFSVFADLFLGSVMALDGMHAGGAFDRGIMLAPVSLGLFLPGMYPALLEPYSRHPVRALLRPSMGCCRQHWGNALGAIVNLRSTAQQAVSLRLLAHMITDVTPPALQVTTLSELSSRERQRVGEPRYFERAVLCNLAPPYSRELRPKLAGRRVSSAQPSCGSPV